MPWQHELPTHLAVPDRVLGPFTMRQVLILLSGASVAYELSMLLRSLPLTVRTGFTAIVIGCTLALALARPGGRGLEIWVGVIARYVLLPKRSVWRPRTPATENTSSKAVWVDHAPALAWSMSAPATAARATRTAVGAR